MAPEGGGRGTGEKKWNNEEEEEEEEEEEKKGTFQIEEQ